MREVYFYRNKSDLTKYAQTRAARDPEFADGLESGYTDFKLGALLRQAREEAGLTQEQVAELLETKKSSISRIENSAGSIRFSTLERYAKAIGWQLALELRPPERVPPVGHLAPLRRRELTPLKGSRRVSSGRRSRTALPEAAEGGVLIHGHNWDWREQCVDTGVVLRIRRSDGPDMLAFAEAGALARHGLNSAGVSLTGNFIGCDRDFTTAGRTPLGLVRRKLLESPNLASALRTAWGHQRVCSTNVMLAASEGEAIDLEMAPDEIFPVEPRDGILVHANHWISPAAQAKLRDTGIGISVCTLYRQRRTEDRLRAKQRPISVADVKNALADEYGKPDSVLRPPKPGIVGSVTCTVCTTIMLPAKGEMWIARKPWIERNFRKYSLAS